MDVLDQAQEIETLHRDAALAAHHAQRESQLIEGNEVICLDCQEPIGLRRLASLPTAVRCLECQQAHELRGKQWKR